MTSFNPKTPNDWARYWYYTVGVNPIPRIGKIPIIKYKEYRNKRIPNELFNEWIDQGKFNENMCCIIGKLSGPTDTLNYVRKGLYLNFCDFDNELAIKEFCNWKGKQFTIEEISKIVYVVQHSDSTHCHIYWLSSKPMPKRTLDKDKKILEKIKNNELPAIEIKAAGDVAFCPGGKHESGKAYIPVGTRELYIIEELGEHIDSICKKYELPVSDSERNKLRRLIKINLIADNNKKSKDKLPTDFDYESQDEEWSEIPESARNNTLFDRARKYLKKNLDLLNADNFRRIVHSWNEKWCNPPLLDFEVDGICSSVLSYYTQQNQEQEDQ